MIEQVTPKWVRRDVRARYENAPLGHGGNKLANSHTKAAKSGVGAGGGPGGRSIGHVGRRAADGRTRRGAGRADRQAGAGLDALGRPGGLHAGCREPRTRCAQGDRHRTARRAHRRRRQSDRRVQVGQRAVGRDPGAGRPDVLLLPREPELADLRPVLLPDRQGADVRLGRRGVEEDRRPVLRHVPDEPAVDDRPAAGPRAHAR